MLSLKISIGATGQVKTMRFVGNMSISDATKEIREKLEEGGHDHGLFQPASKKTGRGARWLQLNRTFNFFDIKTGDELHYKKKHRPLKVLLMDDSKITVLVDDSKNVASHCKAIADKLGLPNPEEYCMLHPKTGRWLDNSEVLANQGVVITDMITFKKKYFITDMNVDKSELKQLNLLYYQCQKAIVAGDYPAAEEEHVSFAALQLQVVYGDYTPGKHNIKFLMAADEVQFLWEGMQKKKVYLAVLRDWEKLTGMKKVDAQYRYTKLARSLATFGIEKFSVGEPVGKKKGKQIKTLPIFIGFSGKFIFRFSKDQKILDTIPIKSLRRWTTLKQELTLDFEDNHALGKYLVYCPQQTGEDVARHLAGYVAILLKLRKESGDVSEVTHAEEAEIENVDPVFGDVFESTTTTITFGGPEEQFLEEGQMGSTPQSAAQGQKAARLVISDVGGAYNAAKRMLEDMDDQMFIDGSAINGTPDALRDSLLEMASRLGKAVSDMVANLGGPDDQINIDAQAVAGNLKGLIDAAKLAAVGTDDQALLEAGRRLAAAVANLLKATEQLSNSPDDMEAKRALQESIESLKGAMAYIKGACSGMLVDPATENLLLASAKRVSDAVQKLAGNVHTAAKQLDTDSEAYQKLLQASKKTALSGRNVDQISKIIAPIAVMKDAQQQLLRAGKQAFNDSQFLVNTASMSQLSEADMAKIAAAAKLVSDAMAQLVNSIGSIESAAAIQIKEVHFALKEIVDGCDMLMESAGDGMKMAEGVRTVSAGRDFLEDAVKVAIAGQPDKTLEVATKKISKDVDDLVGISKDAIENPKNMDYFRRLLENAQRVAEQTNRLLGENAKWVPYDHVRTCAKIVAANATRLAEASKKVLPACKDTQTQKSLFISTKQGEAALAKIVVALRESSKAPRDMDVQNQFVSSMKSTTPTMENMCAKANSAVPNINDPKAKQKLNNNAVATTDALENLLRALGKAQTTEDKYFEEVFRSLTKTDAFLEGSLLDARVEALEQTMPRTQAIKNLAAALRELANGTTVGKKATTNMELIEACRGIAKGVQAVAEASVNVSSSTAGSKNQQAIIEVTQLLVPDIVNMIAAARARLLSPSKVAEAKLQKATREVSDRLKSLLAATQGETGGKECDVAVKGIIEAIRTLNPRQEKSPINRQVLCEDLVRVLKKLSTQANQVAAVSRSNPTNLTPLVSPLPEMTQAVVDATNLCAASFSEGESGQKVLLSVKGVGEHLVRLVGFSKTSKTDPQADKNLTKAQTSLNDQVKVVMKLTAGATPGKKQFDEAHRILNEVADFRRELEKSNYTLGTLATEIERLRELVGESLRAASRAPENLGALMLDAANTSKAIVSNARGYSNITAELSRTQVVDEACKQIRRCRTAADALKATKMVAVNAPRVMAVMKELSQSETDQRVRKDLALASQEVGPALQELLDAAKKCAETGETDEVSDAAEKMTSKLEVLVSASPVSVSAFKLLQASKNVTEKVAIMRAGAEEVATKPLDGIAQTHLTVAGKETNLALDELLNAATALSQGRKEVQVVMEQTKSAIADLDSAAVSAQVGLLQVPTSKTNQLAQESLVQHNKQLAQDIEDLKQILKSGNMGEVAESVAKVGRSLEAVVHAAKETAGTTSDIDSQLKTLSDTKAISEDLLQFLGDAGKLITDPDDKSNQKQMEESKKKGCCLNCQSC